ncbi:MarR family winged helix-turn-helix transcriptional regulator [Mesorhizobium sp. CO1-1-8]|uniref:MarR family winged helix-turn-helix transcriptional regulator n=1 Tax=Mesorhizobium sp. CO1-1-8 TaxID=2876631 RepID=UPI001CD094D9|nr:MarR family transcriptional regulator [Mesorhizobium sp. CO1-1-8]MBZ9772252.1 MarR family transcriptional regulator [Mesorhizobium sp. CO1-1-8]
MALLIASLNKQLQKEMEEQLRPTRIPGEQIRVVEALAAPSYNKGLEMSALARLSVVDPSTLTKVVDRMISEGLVQRAADPNDRRRVRVLLTPKGFAVFEQLRPFRERQEAELQQILERTQETGDANTLMTILEQLCQRQPGQKDAG